MLTLMADPVFEEATWIESIFGRERPAISLGSRFLQLVERTDSISPSTLRRDSSGFMRIMDACEYAFGTLRSGDLLLKFLYGWLRWTTSDNIHLFSGPPDYRSRTFRPDIAEPLGAALEAWMNPLRSSWSPAGPAVKCGTKKFPSVLAPTSSSTGWPGSRGCVGRIKRRRASLPDT